MEFTAQRRTPCRKAVSVCMSVTLSVNGLGRDFMLTIENAPDHENNEIQ
jgi:hypothetical protein